MAMIKCPECGREISDRAQTCPSCGVRIENEVTKCTVCGDVYFKDQAECPHCHHRTANDLNTYNEHVNNDAHSATTASIENAHDTCTTQQPQNEGYTAPNNMDSVQQQQNMNFHTQNVQPQQGQQSYNKGKTLHNPDTPHNHKWTRLNKRLMDKFRHRLLPHQHHNNTKKTPQQSHSSWLLAF